MHKIYRQHWFSFISSSFMSKTFGTFFRGNLLTKMSPNVYWPCRSSWGLFLLALSHFGNFLLAWGHRTTVSVEPCLYFWNFRRLSIMGCHKVSAQCIYWPLLPPSVMWISYDLPFPCFHYLATYSNRKCVQNFNTPIKRAIKTSICN